MEWEKKCLEVRRPDERHHSTWPKADGGEGDKALLFSGIRENLGEVFSAQLRIVFLLLFLRTPIDFFNALSLLTLEAEKTERE